MNESPLRRGLLRHGNTLFEMVVVISIVGVIGTVTVRLFHAMLRQQATAADQLSTSQTLGQLRQRFTEDVHAATTANIEDRQLLLDSADGGQIRWEADDEFIRRTVDDGVQPRIDYFDTPAGYAVHFQRNPISEHTPGRSSPSPLSLVELHWTPNATQRDDRYPTMRAPVQIFAELSRDHRWHTKSLKHGDALQEAKP